MKNVELTMLVQKDKESKEICKQLQIPMPEKY